MNLGLGERPKSLACLSQSRFINKCECDGDLYLIPASLSFWQTISYTQSRISSGRTTMGQNEDFAVAHLRRSVQELGGNAEGFGDPTLMRFLIARSMDTEKAAKMFVEWQKWRATFAPLDYIPESEIQDELRAKKFFLQGQTTKGHPLVIIKAGLHYPSKDQHQFKKVVVHLLDKTIKCGVRGKEIGNEKMVVIFDCEGLSYRNVDPRGMIIGFQFLQAYYPERLGKLYFVNIPAFFVRVWKFVSRFLEKATQEKILMVTNDDEQKEIVAEIGQEVLPEEYGGRAKLIPAQDFVLTPLN